MSPSTRPSTTIILKLMKLLSFMKLPLLLTKSITTVLTAMKVRDTLHHHTHIFMKQTTGITLIATLTDTSMTMRSAQKSPMSNARRLSRMVL